MNPSKLLILLGALALVGCEDSGDSDDDTGESGEIIETDETDVTETDVEESPAPTWTDDSLETFVSCAEGEVTFLAETKGFGDVAQLYITQTRNFGDFDAWGEQHTLTIKDAGGSGQTAYTEYTRQLDTFADLEEQTADQSTLFLCSQDDPGEDDRAFLDPAAGDEYEATFAIAVWDEDQDPTIDDPSDCVVLGQDPEGLLADPTSNDRIDVPTWLNDDNCRTL